MQTAKGRELILVIAAPGPWVRGGLGRGFPAFAQADDGPVQRSRFAEDGHEEGDADAVGGVRPVAGSARANTETRDRG
ncbi:MAG: hypothetical protein U0746_18400 [Gemmataceae bacterium]